MKVRIINKEETARLLPMSECIQVVKSALEAMAGGKIVQPLRAATWMPDRKGLIGTMPAFLAEPASLGVKVVSVFPGNHAAGYDSHQGAVLLFDTVHGALQAIVDAGEITAIRTAAVSALATNELARRDASNLAILGSGVQAHTHLAAMTAAREISQLTVWSRNFEHAQAFVERESKQHNMKIQAHQEAEAAVRDADIICVVTASMQPVLEGGWLKSGAHINAVGACTPAARELDSEAVAKSRLFVDSRESAENESGDYLIPLKDGAIKEDHILAELGEVLVGNVRGRNSEGEITLFKALGLAVEDLAVVRYIYEKALKEDVGTDVEF